KSTLFAGHLGGSTECTCRRFRPDGAVRRAGFVLEPSRMEGRRGAGTRAGSRDQKTESVGRRSYKYARTGQRSQSILRVQARPDGHAARENRRLREERGKTS